MPLEEDITRANSQPIKIESIKNSKTTSFLASPARAPKKRIASLSFAWNTPVNLGAFERNGKLWLIFDHSQQINIEGLKKVAGELAENIIQFPHPLGSLVQVTPAQGVKTSVRKEGLLWILDLYTDDLPQHPFKELTIFTPIRNT